MGRELEHFCIALLGSDGFPYITSVREIERAAENQLAIKAERTIAFSRVLNCDDIPSLDMSSRLSNVSTRDDIFREASLCGFEPEWAEHASFGRNDSPCGDGRTRP